MCGKNKRPAVCPASTRVTFSRRVVLTAVLVQGEISHPHKEACMMRNVLVIVHDRHRSGFEGERCEMGFLHEHELPSLGE